MKSNLSSIYFYKPSSGTDQLDSLFCLFIVQQSSLKRILREMSHRAASFGQHCIKCNMNRNEALIRVHLENFENLIVYALLLEKGRIGHIVLCTLL